MEVHQRGKGAGLKGSAAPLGLFHACLCKADVIEVVPLPPERATVFQVVLPRFADQHLGRLLTGLFNLPCLPFRFLCLDPLSLRFPRINPLTDLEQDALRFRPCSVQGDSPGVLDGQANGVSSKAALNDECLFPGTGDADAQPWYFSVPQKRLARFATQIGYSAGSKCDLCDLCHGALWFCKHLVSKKRPYPST